MDRMHLEIDSKSENESFARVVIAAFITRLDPTLSELQDIKTAVSEAVTNCVIHGYEGQEGKIIIDCSIEDRTVTIIVKDNGLGIENIEKAKEPAYTTKEDMERSGMGFVFMEMFMDEVEVQSKPMEGTVVTMRKVILSNVTALAEE